MDVAEFRRLLLAWYDESKRDLPWRRCRDPYRVWVSEVMLQQTRVVAAIPYYERFLARFPTPQALADAPIEDVLAHWAGLGYYYRARNLHQAAQEIVANNGFPQTYEEILSLRGVGTYTAAAVASISRGLPHAVVDGNVLRVLSRLANDDSDIGTGAAKVRFQALADELLDRDHPGDYNQALMELGATVCLPAQPHCVLCPVIQQCEARAAGVQNTLPVKRKKLRTVEVERTLLMVVQYGKLLLRQRPADETLMPGFYELPELGQVPGAGSLEEMGLVRHSITHHRYSIKILKASVPGTPAECIWMAVEGLAKLPITTVTKKALRLGRVKLA